MSTNSAPAAGHEGPSQAADPVAQAQAQLKAGQIEAAAATAEKASQADPEHADALYILAVCQRYLGRLPNALATLDQLKTLRPAYGRAYQEEGHVHRALGSVNDALRAYRHAVTHNNSLLASWRAITELATTMGEKELVREASEQHRRLAALPRALLGVRSMMCEGQLYKAERVCRAFMKNNPRHIEGMRLLADLGVKAQVLDDAEFLLESALVFEPDNTLARFDYMNILYRRQKYAESLEQARVLRQTEPGNESFKVAYANQCVAVGRYDEALAIYDRIIADRPQHSMLHLLRGHALKTVDRIDDAIAAYRSAAAARPDFGDAYWSLANLKTYRFTDDENNAMLTAAGSDRTDLEDRIHLRFALGKSFEDAQEFDQAFNHYETGNRLRKAQLRFDSQRLTGQLRLQQEHCTAELFAAREGWGHDAPDPIFIVGLPRAGSTLLEQILASHSQIDGTFELPNVAALAHHLDGRRLTDETPRYPPCLADIDEEQMGQFGQEFIQQTRIHRAGAPRFIDKMPNNFRHIGLIHLMLPNAKIIDARRAPMACCFSGFKQLFASGQEFTYGLREIGQYYVDYVNLMDHWDRVLPGKVLRVHYEDVVADLETQVRRILDYLDLSFETGCVEFHRTQRSVRTPSSQQVRQPIYLTGLEQWRNFEPWLGPLKQTLGPLADDAPQTEPTDE